MNIIRIIRKVLLVVPTLLIASVLLLGIPVSAAGSVIYVNAGISASGNGGSWDTAYKDVQSAIYAAESGDQIWVAAGTYSQGTTIELKDGVAIYGGFAGTETGLSQRDYETNKCILSGNDSYTIVSGTSLSSSAVLDGFTITGGSAASGGGEGGGLYNKGGSPTLANLTFTGNSAAFGGGMYNEGGSPTLSRVTFSGNTASDSGGGMYVLASDCPTLTGVIFNGNSPGSDGGGISVSDSGISIINSIFINNTGNGGAIFFDNYGYGTTHTQKITNATFTKNDEALRIYADESSSVATYIYNTIMWDDSAEICLQNGNCYVCNSIIKGSGGSSNWSSSFGTDQGNNLDSDPLFTGTDDFTLQNGSPAIDSGTNSPYESGSFADGVTEDLLGNQRIIDGTVDMGAYEMAVGSISGTVTTGTSPVEGAIVTVAVGSVTLSATTGPDGTYTLKGVLAGSAYTVTATNTDGNYVSVTGVSVASGETTEVNITLNVLISISAIPGVTAPAAGETPVESITGTDQYTVTVTWTPDDSTFEAYTGYTATITLTPKAGYTLNGIDEDFFTVPGAVYVSNEADSGVITAVFPAKEAYTKYNINDGSVVIYTGGDYLVYGDSTATANTITVNKDVEANITLNNVNIDASTAGECAFYITNASDNTNIVNLTLTGTNTLKSGGNYSGLHAYNGKLNFTSESTGTGSLTATGSGNGAGIGSDNGIQCLSINIYGGTITAYGGSSGGAGIGSGRDGSCSTISISGGTVEAHGGTGTDTNYGGAGIGSGYGGSCFSIGISGGEVTAYGGSGGSGIGGSNCAATDYPTSGTCSNITLSGGEVTATGCDSGAGIGGHNISISVGEVTAYGGDNGAGIWIGCYGAGSTVTINSGTVEATGNGAGAGIGGGLNNTADGTVTINGGTVTANSSWGGAGIGGGELGGYNYTITISGGIVTATSSRGAGIGGGDGCSIGSVTINSGTVTAAGGCGSAGIGGGGYGGGGTITINGGVIKANGGASATGSYGPGIGAGAGYVGNDGTVTINGGFVTADGNGTAQDIGYGSSGSLDMTVITGGSVYAVRSKVDPAPMSAASGGMTEYLVTVTGLPESTELTYYVGSSGIEIDTESDSNGNIYLWLPESTAATLLTISDAAKTYIASGAVSSSETNSFEAAEPDTRSSEKSITAFSVGGVSGTIDETSHTIAVTVPDGTDVTSLSPTIALSTGATVSPASGTAVDFTNPVTYTVTAENETTQAYTVTVNGAGTASVTGVTLNKAATAIVKGASETLAAAVTPSSASNQAVTWSSDKDTVATVDQTGKVTGITAGTAIITVTTNDGAKTATCQVTVTEPITAIQGGTVSVNTTPVTITVPSNTTESKIVVTPNTELPLVEVNTASASLGTVEMNIPAGTTASGPAGWNGEITLPTVKAASSATVSGAQTVNAVVEVGCGDEIISFSKAVRLLIPGMAGKSAGYIRNGVFTAITRTISADNQTTANAEIPANGDAKIDVGNDLIIWTKHFTEFIAYTPSQSSSSGDSGSSTSPYVNSSTGSALVTPNAGGKVGIDSYASAEIPAGALKGSTALTVKIEKVTTPPAIPSGFKSGSDIYEFTVDGKSSYSFNKPVIISLQLNAADFQAQETPAIYYYDEQSAQWVKAGGTVSGSAISVAVDHFTKYAILAEKQTKTQTVPKQTSLRFNDLQNHWAQDAINKLADLGAISGYPDGSFKPEAKITRAEFITILVKTLQLTAGKESKLFNDMRIHWAKDSIDTVVVLGIAGGYADGSFKPDEPITREEMAVMAAKAAKMAEVAEETTFADNSKLSSWAKGSVVSAVNANVISGYPDRTFRPQGKTTRAEAVSVILNLIK